MAEATFSASRLAAARRVATEARRGMPQLQGPHRTSRENDSFISEFMGASRLHYIGSWKDRYQRILETMPPPPPLVQLAPGCTRVIAHIDMDCFFASVAVAGRPELEGLPVAVAWSDGNAEIASANYAARAFGVRNGMWGSQAKELCPSLITMPYEFERYEEIAEVMYRAVFAVTPHVMGVSVDECYADLSALGSPEATAATLRETIRTQTGCVASIGIGPNRLLARVATKRAKPDGLHALHSVAEGRTLLTDESVRELPGVGYHIAQKLEAIGVRTCGELRAADAGRIRDALGPKVSATLRGYADATDNRQWEARPTRKSIGAQSSWGVRFATAEEADSFGRQLGEEVGSRLAAHGYRGKHLTLKLWRAMEGAESTGPRKGSMGHGMCDHISRSITLPSATNDKALIAREVTKMLREVSIEPSKLRGMGVSVGTLSSAAAGSGAGGGSGSSRALPARVAAAPPATKFSPEKVPAWYKGVSGKAPAEAPASKPRSGDLGQMMARMTKETGGIRPSKRVRTDEPQTAEPPTRRIGQASESELQMALAAMKETLRLAYATAMLPTGACGACSGSQAAQLLLAGLCNELNWAAADGCEEVADEGAQMLIQFGRDLGLSSLMFAAHDSDLTSGLDPERVTAWLGACDRVEQQCQKQ
jgi:nucleotidyltransferase/DNA polymerase involved in DNA repair